MAEPGLLDHMISTPADSPQVQATSPIFILGIAPRSGTNYLHDLIRMHPDCDPGSTVLEEDNLVANAHLLFKYVNSVSRPWKKKWGQQELQSEREVFLQQLGQGLIAFLSSQMERRKQIAGENGTGKWPRHLVTKTPTVKNLGLFSHLFPTGRLLVLVRDGRSVVESSAKTFNQPYGYTAREWARSAQIIQDFQAENPSGAFLLVRYEDLYSNVEKELRRIFEYLQLDADAYNYAAAANLPVRGSSTLRGSSTVSRRSWVAMGIHWKPVPKGADFNPMDRWASWGRSRHERFNWLAGEHLKRFGYAPKTFSHWGFLWSVWNAFLDVVHVESAVWLVRRVIRKLKTVRSVGEFFAAIRERADLSRNQF